MTNLVQSIPKYLPEEWEASNRINFKDAEQLRAAAESLRDEAKRLRKETHTTTIKTQESTGTQVHPKDQGHSLLEAGVGGEKINENAEENGKLVLDKKKTWRCYYWYKFSSDGGKWVPPVSCTKRRKLTSFMMQLKSNWSKYVTNFFSCCVWAIPLS